MATSQDKLDSLREILLTDDREDTQKILERLDEIEAIFNEKQSLSGHVSPIIKDHIEKFSKSIPEKLGPTITEALENQIKNSKDKVVEALYPIMGKMIKRYVQNEIKLLSEKINKKMSNTFSFKRKVRSVFTGANEGDIILSELIELEVLQVLVIEKNSGILLGTFAKEDTIDKDMISGMLTAIKSFVEDAFEKGNQNLETIEYELYNIHIQNFHSYYIATVISGALSVKDKDSIENKTIDIAKEINEITPPQTEEKINSILERYFDHEDN